MAACTQCYMFKLLKQKPLSLSSLPPSYLLDHGSHSAGDGVQVVGAEVDLRQRGEVTEHRGELAQVVVGQVEAPQAAEPGGGETREGGDIGEEEMNVG